MTALLALFTRSLREDARARTTYFTRAGLAGFVLLMSLSNTVDGSLMGAPGLEFFTMIIALQTAWITIAGLSHLASVITEEKEEQTLGLLRMTNLDPLSILLGKSTSRLLGALLLLAAAFPFALLAVTLGGVSVRQVMACFVALGAYTFLLCNLALLTSVIARRTANAAAWTTLIVAVLMSAGPLLEGLHQWLTGRAANAAITDGVAAAADELGACSLPLRFTVILETGYAGPVGDWLVGSHLLLGVGCFVAAWAGFATCCDHAEAGAAGTPGRRFLGIRLRRPPRPARRALLWKEFHFACGGRAGLHLRGLGYGLAVVVMLALSRLDSGGVSWGILTALNVIVPLAFEVEVAVMSANLFGSEVRHQTLSTLVTLPLTARQIFYGKTRACLLVAIPGAIGVALTAWIYSEAMARASTFIVTGSLGPLSTFSNVIFLGHLVAWLSLLMKRGALPLGLVLNIAFGMLTSTLMLSLVTAGGLTWESMTWTQTTIDLGAALILHRQILRRFDTAAGES